MNRPTIYLAAAFTLARFVDEQVAAAATARGYQVRSSWHAPPYAAENLEAMAIGDVRAIADKNDSDLAGSDVVLVLIDGGRETLCELRLATILSIPVVAVSTSGSFPLSAYRIGVTRHTSLGAAYDALAGMAQRKRGAA